jgi:hypothetical protein
MGDGEREKHGYLEIYGQGDEPHEVPCPRRGPMPLHECLGCKRYHSLVLGPEGKHVYLDCDWVGADDVRPEPEVDESLGAMTEADAARRRGEPDKPG